MRPDELERRADAYLWQMRQQLALLAWQTAHQINLWGDSDSSEIPVAPVDLLPDDFFEEDEIEVEEQPVTTGRSIERQLSQVESVLDAHGGLNVIEDDEDEG